VVVLVKLSTKRREKTPLACDLRRKVGLGLAVFGNGCFPGFKCG